MTVGSSPDERARTRDGRSRVTEVYVDVAAAAMGGGSPGAGSPD